MAEQSSGKDLQELAQQLADSGIPQETANQLIDAKTLACKRPPYSPGIMVQLMIDNPDWSHAQLASHFGRLPSWTSTVLASDAFQTALDSRRHEVADPSLSATMEERFKGLAIRAATVLQEKLNGQGVSDLVVLKAAELGIKALGMGHKPSETPQLPSPTNSSESVAEKLLAAMDARDRARTIDVETVEVKDES